VQLTVQVVLETDDDQDPAVVCDVFTLERGPLTADTVGLRLAEANDLLAAVQQTLVAEQARATVAAQARCPHCGTPHRRKDSRDIVMRTLRQVVQADRHRRVLRAVGRLGDRQGAFQQRPGRRRLPQVPHHQRQVYQGGRLADACAVSAHTARRFAHRGAPASMRSYAPPARRRLNGYSSSRIRRRFSASTAPISTTQPAATASAAVPPGRSG
jgi:hypothetical protein